LFLSGALFEGVMLYANWGVSMKSKLWTQNFIINTATNFLIYLVYYFLIVITASHAMNVLRATASEAGLATGLFVIGGLIARLTAAGAVEKLGYKNVLYLGLFIYLFTSLLYFLAASLPVLYIVRLLHGFGFGMGATATGAIAARLVPQDRRGEGIGYYGLSMTLASAVGPLAGVYINQHSSFNVVLLLSSVITAACILISVFIRLPDSFKPNAARQAPGGRAAAGFIEKTSLPIALVTLLVVFGYSSILAFLPKFAQSTGNGGILAASGVFFLVYSVFVLLSRPVTGRLFDRYGENFLIYPSIVIFAAGLLTLGLSGSGFVMLCAAALVGFGYGTFFSSANAAVVKIAPDGRIHLATSTYFAFADLGAGVGPFILGFLITSGGYRNLYCIMAALVLCCVAAYYFAHGRNAAPAGRAAITPTKELVRMKLVYAIINYEDEREVMHELSRQGFKATKQATSGGFLRKSNITLMIGTSAEKVKDVIDIIRSKSYTRQSVKVSSEAFGIEGGFAPFADSIDIGGATIFVVDVEHFEKI